MFALVLARERVDRDVIRWLLGARRVEVAADLPAARAACEWAAPSCIVLAWPTSGGADTVTQLRAMTGEPRPHLIALLDDRGRGEIAEACAAGVDDFIRRPWCAEELLARLSAPERRASRLASLAHALEYTSLEGYRRLGEVAASELSTMIGAPLSLAEGFVEGSGARVRGASVALTMATEGVELRVSVLTDQESLPALGDRLLGDPRAGAASLDDALRELANAAAGAAKRACGKDVSSLTMGLATDVRRVPPQGPTSRRWCASLRGVHFQLGIVGEILARPKQDVTAARLTDGMVIARDVHSDTGVLLAAAGTRLTATSAPRLALLLGHDFIVQVAAA